MKDLFNVPPRLVTSDARNGGGCYAEIQREAGDCGACFSGAANVLDVRFGQFGVVMLTALWNAFGVSFGAMSSTTSYRLWVSAAVMSIAAQGSALANHVGSVIGVRSQKQMIRAYASRIVAVMADKARIVCGDFSISQCVSHAMSMSGASTKPEFTVAVRPDISDPFPTSVRLPNARPKAHVYGDTSDFIRTSLGTVSCVESHGRDDRCPAFFASLRNRFRSDTCATANVALVRAELSRLAWAMNRSRPTDDTNALNFWRVDARHAHREYHELPQ